VRFELGGSRLVSLYEHQSSSSEPRLTPTAANRPLPTANRPPTAANRQHLYDELRAIYRRPSRPSGLTLVDSVAVKQSKQSW
jgi:hypothetical protein